MDHHHDMHFKRRLLSLIAATCIALACGTNYAYSAWAPQFANKMDLSATQSNLIGMAGNIGVYGSGVPVGMLVDSKGPRPSVLMGAISLLAGYYPIYKAYDSGPGSMSVALVCFFSFLTGFGSCAAFSASIKVCALNWPNHRGTATCFPLSAFGLSALFFTAVSGLAFPGSTSNLLLFLAIGSFTLPFTSMFMLHVHAHEAHLPKYSAVEDGSRPEEARGDPSSLGDLNFSDPNGNNSRFENVDPDADEISSLISNTSSPKLSRVSSMDETKSKTGRVQPQLHKLEVTGVEVLRKLEFWKLWIMLGLLAGVGIMTINNVGNDVQALWAQYNDSISSSRMRKQQLLQVSLISLMSFFGRIISGTGSDYLVKIMGRSRFWCLVGSSAMFICAQIAALTVENPNWLWLVSSLTGLGYGTVFGVFPALTADAFGVLGLSLNWGFMTMSPVVSGNIFNLSYGAIYDSHKSGEEAAVCEDGLECYRSAYLLSLGASTAGLLISLWSVRHEITYK